MNMKWSDINVFQFQQIMDTIKSVDAIDYDISIRLAAIVTGKTEHQIDSMPTSDLAKLLKDITFVASEIEPKPARYIQTKKRRFRCVYDVRQIRAARYIEAKHFSGDIYQNLHRIAASLVVPQKRAWWGGWVDDVYHAEHHDVYADELLAAPITNVFGSVVFFYRVFNELIRNSADYLTTELMTMGIPDQSVQGVQNSWKILVGYIPPNWLQNTKVSRWRRFLISKLSVS